MTFWNWVWIVVSEVIITSLLSQNKYGRNGIEEQVGRTEHNLKLLEGTVMKGFKMLGLTEERLNNQPGSPNDRHY